MPRRKILILGFVFLATLPVSYVTTALVPQIGVRASDAITRLGASLVTAADVAYLLLTILTSLFFTLIAWLFMKTKEESATKGVK